MLFRTRDFGIYEHGGERGESAKGTEGDIDRVGVCANGYQMPMSLNPWIQIKTALRLGVTNHRTSAAEIGKTIA